jgi:hypothetical protein
MYSSVYFFHPYVFLIWASLLIPHFLRHYDINNNTYGRIPPFRKNIPSKPRLLPEYSKAFPSLPWCLVEAWAKSTGIHGTRVWTLIKKLQRDGSFVLRRHADLAEGEEPKRWTHPSGLREGETLSPLLFVIVLSGVMRQWEAFLKAKGNKVET